jgi:hypothetical protein
VSFAFENRREPVEDETSRRRLVQVDPAEPRRGQLWAFGVASIAKAAKVHPETVRRAIRLGALDAANLMAVAEWINLRQLHGQGARTGRAQVARAAGVTVRSVDEAVLRGELDLTDASSIKVWARARRAGRQKPEPGPALQGFTLIRSSVPRDIARAAKPATGGARRAWTVARAAKLVTDLRAIGFATAERRGPNHVYLKPDILTLADAARLLERMQVEGWTASDLTREARRRLGVFGGVSGRVERARRARRKRPTAAAKR